MKSKIQLAKAFLVLTLLAVPEFVFAQTQSSNPVGGGLDKIKGAFGGTGGLTRATDINSLIYLIIRMLLGVGGAIAVLFIIIGGYQYMTSGGNDEQAEKGRKTLVNAVIGVVIIILSYVIITVVVNAISRTSILG